jgi:hypothetical protein
VITKIVAKRVICALRKVKNFDRIGHGAAVDEVSREAGACISKKQQIGGK